VFPAAAAQQGAFMKKRIRIRIQIERVISVHPAGPAPARPSPPPNRETAGHTRPIDIQERKIDHENDDHS
jgi:hypothetical protein